MSVGKRIARNTSILAFSHILSKALYLVLIIILTRYLGTEGFGLYSFALAYVMLFMPLTHMGMTSLLIRDIARQREKGQDIFSAIWPLALAFSLLAMLSINGIALVISDIRIERLVIAALSIYLVFDSWSRFAFAVFRGHERLEFEAIVNIVERVTLFIATLIAWWLSLDIVLLMLVFAGTQFVKAALALSWVGRHFFHFHIRWDSEFCWKFLREAYPFLLFSVFSILSIRIDLLMLKYFHTDEIVGIYNVGRRLTESLWFIPEVLYSALFPALSALYLSQREQFRSVFQQAFHYMTVLGLPLAAGIFVLAPQIIAFFFEPEFQEGDIALRWLSVNLGILFMKHLCVAALGAAGKQRVVSNLMLLDGASEYHGLNYLLIPGYVILGAGIATAIAEAITFVLFLFFSKRYLDVPRMSSTISKSVFATVLVAATAWLLQDLHLILVAAISTGTYLILVWLLKMFSAQDWRKILALIPGKKADS